MVNERNVSAFFMPSMMSISFFVFFFDIILSTSPGFAKATVNQQVLDKITELPGQPPVSFNQFSGYVTVNEQHGRALFYWLTESPTHSDTKPLVLWLTGGPGCSSVVYGASDGIGPFRVNQTGSSLYLNKYSWNRVANILFLESPAGVGFSYTNTSSDLKNSGDKRTAQDALIFLLRWMSRFPQYKHRDFYMAGESYAGNYVPQLAKRMQEYNKASSNPIINLKGFLVGNAVIDNHYDRLGRVNYWWSHSMISDKTYQSILKHCNFSQTDNSPSCDKALSYAMNHEFGQIDQYSIYTPMCPTPILTSNGTGSSSSGSRTVRPENSLLRRRVYGYDPCTEHYAERYYNRRDVQITMHANTTGIPYKWAVCSDVLFKNWKDSEFSMLPTYKELMAAGLRIWLFSGDMDSVVPVTATRFSLSRLNLRVKTPWYPWYSARQVGGWTEVYEGLTFVTVRGAGHVVRRLQPRRAFNLFQAFLLNQKLPPMAT